MPDPSANPYLALTVQLAAEHASEDLGVRAQEAPHAVPWVIRAAGDLDS